ncbi:MAG: SH3 domain-containing protein, partial [Lachnospiraceae bacterium]|nr:SH3 domain-containing protein [Lachnospiraceae bacterium]
MLRNFKVRITALTCASLLSIISIAASPFKISDNAPDGGVLLNVPEVEMDSFNLDGGVAGITERDIYVEAVEKKAAQKEKEVEVVVEEEVPEEEDINFVMANVQNSVNVRAEANTNCEVVGMLYNKCGGTILEEGDGWTKIESGELVGWVRNDFLYFGEDAREYAEKVCDKIARVNVECLRIRKG